MIVGHEGPPLFSIRHRGFRRALQIDLVLPLPRFGHHHLPPTRSRISSPIGVNGRGRTSVSHICRWLWYAQLADSRPPEVVKLGQRRQLTPAVALWTRSAHQVLKVLRQRLPSFPVDEGEMKFRNRRCGTVGSEAVTPRDIPLPRTRRARRHSVRVAISRLPAGTSRGERLCRSGGSLGYRGPGPPRGLGVGG